MIDIFSRQTIGAGTASAPAHAPADRFPAATLARKLSPDRIREMVEYSGLGGKGGAGFPMHRKLALMQRQRSEQKYLIVNGSEHEPGSSKDRFLLEEYPETVLEGAVIMAHAAGAQSICIAVNESFRKAIALLETAIGELTSGELGDAMPFTSVVAVPESYIVGEESALLEVLSGRPALPRKRPPHPIESGLHEFPTLIQNVETVAHLPYIVAYGSDDYRALGRDGLAVTLCTFGPEFMNSGVRLVPLGIPLAEIVNSFGGGLKSGKPIKAVQPGGPSAGFLSRAELDVPFDHRSLKDAGSALGCGAIRAFADGDDMVGVVAEIMEFFSANSCGQCPSCRMETQMLSSIMKQTLAGRANERLTRQIPVIINANAGKGICSLIAMPAPPILSALSKFGDEFQAHICAHPPPPVRATTSRLPE